MEQKHENDVFSLSEKEAEKLLFVGALMNYGLTNDSKILSRFAVYAGKKGLTPDNIAAQGLYVIDGYPQTEKPRLRRAVCTVLNIMDKTFNPVDFMNSTTVSKRYEELRAWMNSMDERQDTRPEEA